MEKLFVYGTLQDSRIQKLVIGRSQEGGQNVLEGYRKEEIKIEDEHYPILVPDPKKSVSGKVLLVTPEELKAIDEYETRIYKRITVTLKDGAKAWVYASAADI